MSESTRIVATGICLLVLGTGWLYAEPPSAASWSIGDPIVTYWAGPGADKPLTQQEAAQVRAGGWNLGWARSIADLDILYEHGIRGMLAIGTPNIDEPAQAKALDELIQQVRTHPALYSYHLVDEPGAGAFPKLGKLVAFLRQRDPAHLAYINLLPTYASDGPLQVSDDTAERARVGYPQDFAGISTDDTTSLRYREHLRQFIETVKPQLISYDHYHFLKNSDGAQYFLNLALIRATALDAKLPFMNIIQACDSPAEGWRGPGENELRWLTFTSLAYGAQGISHFRYDVGLWKDAATPQPLYWTVSRLNREFLAMASVLQPLTSLGAYHCGSVPLGAQPLPPASAFVPDPPAQDVLLGYFGQSVHEPTHVVVVNLNYRQAVTTVLTGPGPMEEFHAPTRSWHVTPEGSRVTLHLQPGGGAMIRRRQ